LSKLRLLIHDLLFVARQDWKKREKRKRGRGGGALNHCSSQKLGDAHKEVRVFYLFYIQRFASGGGKEKGKILERLHEYSMEKVFEIHLHSLSRPVRRWRKGRGKRKKREPGAPAQYTKYAYLNWPRECCLRFLRGVRGGGREEKKKGKGRSNVPFEYGRTRCSAQLKHHERRANENFRGKGKRGGGEGGGD